MKKFKPWMKVLSVALALVLALSPVITQAASSFGVKYVYDDVTGTTRTAIQSVVIDDMTYYDILGGSKEDTLSGKNTLLYSTALTSDYGSDDGVTALSAWSDVAYNVFAACGTTSTIGDISNFSDTSSHRNESGYADISALLNQTDKGERGSQKNDRTTWTGLTVGNSLSEVRQKAADSIADSVNRKISGDDILSHTGGDDCLALMDDSKDTDQTPVLYSFVTCLRRAGKTYKYAYDCFGLAFYDFSVQVIANNNLSYITAAEGYSSIEDAYAERVSGTYYSSGNEKNEVLSYYQNGSKSDANVGMEFNQTSSMTASNTMETSTSYSFQEMIGSETKISAGIDKVLTFEQTLKMEFTTGQTISTAYSDTSSYTESVSNTVSANMTIPGNSAVGIQSYNATTELSLDYNCPIAINYKVAIFSLSGDVYDDGAATRAFSTAGYSQSHFCAIFGADTSSSGTTATSNLKQRAIVLRDQNGFESVAGNTYGYNSKHGGSTTTTSELDWSKILSGEIDINDLTAPSCTIYVQCYEVDENGNLQYNVETETREVVDENGDPVLDVNGNPTYEEVEISRTPVMLYSYEYGTLGVIGYQTTVTPTPTVNGGAYTIYTGKVTDYEGNLLQGDPNDPDTDAAILETNAENDSNYKIIYPYPSSEDPDDDSEQDVAKFYYQVTPAEPAKLSATDIVSSLDVPDEARSVSTDTEYGVQTLDATGQDINDDVIWLCSHTPMSIMGATINMTGNSMYSEIYDVEAMYPLDHINVTSGQKVFNMQSGQTLNLDNIEVEGYNDSDVVYYGFDQGLGYWILTDEDGNEIEETDVGYTKTDGTGTDLFVAGDVEGTVYLQYMIDEDNAHYVYMNSATEAKNEDLTSTARVQINVDSAEFYGTVQATGGLTGYVGEDPINLDNSDEVKGYVYDETEKKISNAVVSWDPQLDEDDGIILENNRLSFTKAGEFLIRAVYTVGSHKYRSNWITVTALPKKELTTITISDDMDPATLAPIILNDGDNMVNLDNLTLAAYDQYDFDWTDLDNLTWYVDGEEVEPSSSFASLPVYTAAEAGDHVVYAECDGVKSNELIFTVKEARRLDSITIASDELTKNGLDDNARMPLSEITVTALDQYGDPYDYTTMDYAWSTSGVYAAVTNPDDTATGTLNGIAITTKDYVETLTLTVGDVVSNTLEFTVSEVPYLAELYTNESNIILEGDVFSLDDLDLVARDQNGDAYTLSDSERASITWELTDKGTIKGEDKVSLDAEARTLVVNEGSVSYGKQGDVILNATITNAHGQEITGAITVHVRQQAILDKLELALADSAENMNNGESERCSHYFVVTGYNQYGDEYDLSDTELTWASDNEESIAVDNDSQRIIAGKSNTSANICVSNVNAIGTEVVSNEVVVTVNRVPTIESIEILDAPESLPFDTEFCLNDLNVVVYDDLGEALTEEELAAYPATIHFSLEAGDTEADISDTTDGIYTLSTGSKYGYITISAYAANVETKDTVIDSDGEEIDTSTKIWIGPYVEDIALQTYSLTARGGDDAITITGESLSPILVVLYDAAGNIVIYDYTTGDETSQTYTLELPDNYGGAGINTYTLKFSIDGGTTFLEDMTTEVTVSNLVPSDSVSLNKESLTMSIGDTAKLTATLKEDDTTDGVTWSSSNPYVVKVDAEGTITAVNAGKAVITVKTDSGKKATCTVVVGLKKGAKYSSGIYTYEVTNANTNGTGTMKVTGFVKGKYAKKVKIKSSVDFNGIKYKVTAIGKKAFKNNKKITSVNTGKNVTKVGNKAFLGCKNIKKITVTDSVKNLGKKAFYNCYGLKKLTMGKKVKTVGSHCFCNNSKLSTIKIKTKNLKKVGKPHAYIQVNKATVYVPAKKYNQYKKLLSKRGLEQCTFKKLKK